MRRSSGARRRDNFIPNHMCVYLIFLFFLLLALHAPTQSSWRLACTPSGVRRSSDYVLALRWVTQHSRARFSTAEFWVHDDDDDKNKRKENNKKKIRNLASACVAGISQSVDRNRRAKTKPTRHCNTHVRTQKTIGRINVQADSA